jgi:hypothetical protein
MSFYVGTHQTKTQMEALLEERGRIYENNTHTHRHIYKQKAQQARAA